MRKAQIVSIVGQTAENGNITGVELARALATNQFKVMVIGLVPSNTILNKPILVKSILNNVIPIADNVSFLSLALFQNHNQVNFGVLKRKDSLLYRILAFINSIYDYIIITSSLDEVNLNTYAFYVSQWILIPVNFENLSLYELKNLIQKVNQIKLTHNPDLQLLGILQQNDSKHFTISFELKDYIINVLGLRIFNHSVSHQALKYLDNRKVSKINNIDCSLEYLAFSEELLNILKGRMLSEK